MSGSYEERELAIQKEILRNGPVATNMLAPKYFRFYKNGVLTTDSLNDAIIDDKLLQLNLIDEDDQDSAPETRIIAEASIPNPDALDSESIQSLSQADKMPSLS